MVIMMMSDNKKTILSEERIFGETFTIIRRKYAPEKDGRKNIILKSVSDR